MRRLKRSSLSSLLPLFSLLLTACGSGEESADDSSQGDSSSGNATEGGATPPESFDNLGAGSTVTVGPAVGQDLGFGSLTSTSVTLPGGLPNAPEVYQVAHYIARTDGEQNEKDIDIPIRSYVASCKTDSEEPHLFVSVSVQTDDDSTSGSVYELAYDADSGGFVETGNAALLTQCYESHGITVSPDCSRVAVLCNMPYRAHESYPGLTADLVEENGTAWQKRENNHAEVDAKTSDPEERAKKYKEQDQIWLLEWNGQDLSEEPDSYVVHKTHGGTHLGAEELIYVHDDSTGKSTYGFSVTARTFDSGGGSHYSAGLNIIDRDTWRLNPEPVNDDYNIRGWDWACGDGHVLNIRGFYNPANERFGAICTSDWNDWIGSTHGQLGTIAIKMEHSSSTSEGRAQYFVPSNATMTSNGGGHTVVPLDETTNLSVIVAPNLIAESDMNRFLETEIGVDPSSGGPFDEDCASWDENNCYFTYVTWEYWEEDGKYSTVERQGLMSGPELTSAELTRIGVARVNAESGSISGTDYRWIVEDDDCQLSDPQLVPLGDGRFLFGYARFQCISDGGGFERVYGKRGAQKLLVPKEYFLAEVDADGNLLEGPVSIGAHGWGGLDEPVQLGPGRVAWTYIQKPTIEDYGGGSQNEWEALIYTSTTLD